MRGLAGRRAGLGARLPSRCCGRTQLGRRGSRVSPGRPRSHLHGKGPPRPPLRPRVGTCSPGGLRTGGGLGLWLCALVPTRSPAPAPTPASSHPSAPGSGGRREPGPRFRPGSRPLAAAAAPRPRAALGSQPRGRGGAGAGRGLAWERRWQPRCAGPRPAGPAGPLNPPLFARCHTALPA